MKMMTLIFMIMMISMFLMKISFYMSFKMNKYQEKMNPFECGFEPLMMNRLPFSIHFFLITLIFLIFDIEITLVLPMIKTFMYIKTNYWMFISSMIIIILLMGLIHEWYQGALNWL